MGASDNDSVDDGDADDARCRQWASPTSGMRTMGPRTIEPRMMGITKSYVVENGVADDWAADNTRR